MSDIEVTRHADDTGSRVQLITQIGHYTGLTVDFLEYQNVNGLYLLGEVMPINGKPEPAVVEKIRFYRLAADSPILLNLTGGDECDDDLISAVNLTITQAGVAINHFTSELVRNNWPPDREVGRIYQTELDKLVERYLKSPFARDFVGKQGYVTIDKIPLSNAWIASGYTLTQADCELSIPLMTGNDMIRYALKFDLRNLNPEARAVLLAPILELAENRKTFIP